MQELSIQLFESEQFGNLRTIMDENGNPLFCAKDVAVALGYKDPTNAIKRHCRGVAFQHPLQTAGGIQQVRFITEGDMYRLVASSKLDAAVEFESWVFDKVIPSIRKHGMYATPQMVEDMLADPNTMIRTLQALKEEREKVQALTDDNARMLPKALAYDGFMESDGSYSVQKVARFLAQVDERITGKRLYALLRADELVCKQSRCPTKKAIDRGLARQIMAKKTNGDAAEPYVHLTQKGVDYCIQHYVTVPKQMKAI